MQGYEADKVKKKNQHNGKKKDVHAPLRLIQVEIAGAEGRRGGEQRLRETVFRTHLVCAQKGWLRLSVQVPRHAA